MPVRNDPIREWREGFARRFLKLDFAPQSDAPFRADFAPIFDGMRIVEGTFSPGSIVRDAELIKDGDDAYSFVISKSKRLDAIQRGRHLQLANGDAVLLRSSELGDVGSHESFKLIAMMVPLAEIEARTGSAGAMVAQRLPHGVEALQLLRGYLSRLARCQISDSSGRDTVRRHIIDLVALALTPYRALGESGLSAVSSAHIAAALDFIETHFRRPELSLSSVAQALEISPRHLQRLIETTGTPLTARVNELRLQEAHRLLTTASGNARRISDIALEVGFSDISHFNRRFRSRYGLTPRDLRQGTRRPIAG